MSISIAVADHVVPADDALADAEPDRGPAALGLARGSLVGGQARAAAEVASRLLRGLLRLAVGVELVRAAVAGVGGVVGQEPVGRRRVVGQALHLAVRRVGPELVLGPATPGPSSQAIPSQWRPSRMSFSNASVLRATSVSSSRSTNVPPVCRANR